MKQEVSKISAEKDGVFFVRGMTDVSVMTRTPIEASCFKLIQEQEKPVYSRIKTLIPLFVKKS